MNEKTILAAAACAIAFVVGMKFQQARAGKQASQATTSDTADGFWFANYRGLY